MFRRTFKPNGKLVLCHHRAEMAWLILWYIVLLATKCCAIPCAHTASPRCPTHPEIISFHQYNLMPCYLGPRSIDVTAHRQTRTTRYVFWLLLVVICDGITVTTAPLPPFSMSRRMTLTNVPLAQVHCRSPSLFVIFCHLF